MQVFIKSVEPSQKKSKLLFLMGSTWHTQCMFDLDCNEDSFADLLQQRNIESYTFDNYGIGTSSVVGTIGNAHLKNVQQAVEIINEYQIDSILAYSYGVTVLMDLLEKLPPSVTNLILLDPYPALTQPTAELLDQGDKKLITKGQVSELLSRHKSTATPYMIEEYLDKLSTNDALAVPTYPAQILQEKFNHFCSQDCVDTFKNMNVKIIFTGNAREALQSKFANHMCVTVSDSSHWILIEPARYKLIDVIEQYL